MHSSERSSVKMRQEEYAIDDPRRTKNIPSSASLSSGGNSGKMIGDFVKVEEPKVSFETSQGPRWYRMLHYLSRTWIPNAVALVILFDLGLTCIDVDERAAGRSLSPGFILALDFCVVVYTLEFVLNACILRQQHFTSLMTWVDVFVVVCGWMEIIMYQIQNEDLSFLRDFRVLRVVRICRLAFFIRKARALRELRKMITMFGTCVKTLAWSLLFCFGMMTIWAILLVELVNPLCCTEEDVCTECAQATGSIMDANLLLFKTVIAGDDWGDIAVPIIQASPWTAILFCGSLLTLVFGVMNLVVAVVVDTFAEARERDMMNLAEELELTNEDDRKRLLKMFERIEREGEDGVTLPELIEGVRQDRELQSRLRVMDIDEVDLEQLFYMIDADGSGTVEAEEFITPLSRWVHESKTATRFIKYNLMRYMQQQEAFIEDVSYRLDRLWEHVGPGDDEPTHWDQIPDMATVTASTAPTQKEMSEDDASDAVTEPPRKSGTADLFKDLLHEQSKSFQPFDKFVALPGEDSLKSALARAERLLVASNKELLDRSLHVMKGVFQDVADAEGCLRGEKRMPTRTRRSERSTHAPGVGLASPGDSGDWASGRPPRLGYVGYMNPSTLPPRVGDKTLAQLALERRRAI